MIKRRIYTCTDEISEVLENIEKVNNSVTREWRNFAEKYNGTGKYFATDSLIAIEIKDVAPLGWFRYKHNGDDLYIPTRNPVCIEAYREFMNQNMRISSAELSMLTDVMPIAYNDRFEYPKFYNDGESYFLMLTDGMKPPAGCELYEGEKV